jgi:hypothetical protein
VLAAAALVAFAAWSAAPPSDVDAQTRAAAPVPSQPGIHAAPEYFTDVWSDQLDFNSAEDFDTTPNRRARGVAASVANGVLEYTNTAPSGRLYFVFAEPNEVGAVGHRSSWTRPLDPNVYRRVAFRAWTDRDIVAVLVWNHCVEGGGPACEGYKTVQMRAGWHHYDLDMSGYDDWDSYRDGSRPTSVWGAPWTGGPIHHLGFQPSITGTTGVRGVFDHVRAFQPGTSLVQVTSTRGAGQELWYDADADPSNNGTSRNQEPSAGVLRPIPSGTTTVDMGSLPSGWYRLETSQSGTNLSNPSATFTVDAAPRPVVLDPDITGSGDWHAEVAGNPLDFSDPGDVFTVVDGLPSVRNATPGLWDGWLHATSAGRFDDPQVFLSDARWKGPLIDATEWHRVSWRIAYDGGWGTNAVPGEGLDLRLCWQQLSGQPSCSKDVFPATRATTYAVALRTLFPGAVEHAGYSGLGWGGPASQLVHMFRLDPHEDPGSRSWHLDGVRLAHDDRVPAGGGFPIRFRDDHWEPGTIADVYIDGDLGPDLGRKIADRIAVGPGENVVWWDGAGFAPGIYGVHVVMRDPRGSVRLGSATGPLDLPHPARWAPVGSLDAVAVNRGSVTVGGWVVDPDHVRGVTSVHVYVDGVGHDGGLALGGRADLAAVRSDYGAFHGFSVTVPAAPGARDVCVYGINFGHGVNSLIGCRGVVVK